MHKISWTDNAKVKSVVLKEMNYANPFPVSYAASAMKKYMSTFAFEKFLQADVQIPYPQGKLDILKTF